MPFKVWAVGEEVLAADFNSYVQQQVSSRFADAAARTAGLAAPVSAQLSMFTGALIGELDFWDGVKWVRHVPRILCGTTSVTTNASGIATLTLPAGSFSSTTGMNVLIQDWSSATGGLLVIGIVGGSVTVNSVQIAVRRTDIANTPPHASATLTVSWIALGPWGGVF